jgi:hypothetical protein
MIYVSLQCVNFFAKLGTFSDADFSTHVYHPEDIRGLLNNNAIKILFLREWLFLFSLVSFFSLASLKNEFLF